MIILDTNVISALMRPELNPVVVAWLDRQKLDTIWATAISIMENRAGIILLPFGKRQVRLMEAFDRTLTNVIVDRVLPFDRSAAESAARLSAMRTSVGRNVPPMDTLIAGIVLARGATLATRNVKDFADLDIPLVDPWQP